MKDIYERLIELLDYSYSPYSGFRVASIAVSKGGERFEGVNVESASYSLTICAERSALFRAISAGVEAGEIEEVHILAYFETLEAALAFREELYPYLPPVKNDPDYFGDQVVVDEEDNIVKVEEKLLVNSLLLSVDQCVEMVERYGGVVVPAHVDRETYGIIGQLGFVPDYLGFRAVEISRAVTPQEALARWPELEKYTLVGFSDAHYLEDIGKVETHFYMEEPSWGELVEALADRERVRIVRPKGDETG